MTRAGAAWAVLALTGIALFGNYYVYDSIGPLAEQLARELGYSDTQIGTLNAIYSVPNIVLVFVGGVLVDRYGPGLVTFWTALVCLAGALLTAVGTPFAVMAAGRLLFGIGAETMIVATIVALGIWFAGRQLALAMALSISFARLGSYTVDLSPLWAPDAYASGWQAPLWLAAGVMFAGCLAAWVYRRLEANAAARGVQVQGLSRERIELRSLAHFNRGYWYVLALCVLFYAVIFPFRSTFAIKYFQHTGGMTLEAASVLNSHVFLAAVIATPLFGWVNDRIGRHGLLLTLGAASLVAAFCVLGATDLSPGVSTALIGVAFSLVPAVLWPAVTLLVAPQRLGTAYGFMTMLQNIGMAGANFTAGALNDANGASASHPDGYLPMIGFFAALSALALVAAVLFWRYLSHHGAREPAS
ncbi:MAG TPA: MFS transporter [Steroidobacteraceae bacterium]|nr:MFS transporter [Steroidobacteraceae bacterium]HNS27775.1 MFS transporter [Steroidobacteraceae bacterium]